MSDFQIRLGSLPGVQQTGSSKARTNVERTNSPLSGGGTDSVSISKPSLLGTSAKDHNVDFGAISKLSLGDAQAQLNPSTNFGLSLF